MATDAQEYICEVREVFSGDDLIVFVDLGVEGLWKRQRVRLHGVDTPNGLRTRDGTEAGDIRQEVKRTIWRRRGRLTVIARNTSSWVGVLVVDTAAGPVNINEWLIARGFAHKSKQIEVKNVHTAPSSPHAG